jgi:hypothetical protein
MNAEGYRAPSIRSIVGGCLLALLILAPLLFISTVVKWVGAPFLFLPQSLGLLPAATRAEVRTIDLSTSPNQVDLPAAGPYLVYTDNFELLDVTLQLEQSNATPWLRVSDPSSGAFAPMTYVERGLMPFDPVFVRGRPVFRFVASRPGTYTVEHMTRNSQLAIIPDRTTGYEMQMLLAALVQAALVVWLVGSLVRRRARERAARIEALLAPGRVSPKELQRRHSGGEGPPADNTRA